MKFIKFLLSCSFLLFSSNAFSNSSLQLPEIRPLDIKKISDDQQSVINILNDFDLSALESDERSATSVDTKRLLDHLIDIVDKRVFPRHLREFDSKILNENSDKDVFAEYRGVSAGCYQFRVYYKYQDDLVVDSKWASSILTIPSSHSEPSGSSSSVVLAPSLLGPTMFIEGGYWPQLCKRGVASLLPESFYLKRWFGRWKKIPFDPAPVVDDALDFSLYERSILRFERILNKNLAILRDFKSLRSITGDLLKDLPVANLVESRVGYWGSSLGAIVGSVIVGKDPKIKGAVLTVSGGNLANVITKSKIHLFKSTKEKQMEALGLRNDQEYENILADNIKTDPLNFVSEMDKERVFMIIGERDRSVPAVNQYELFQQFGKPKHLVFPANHALTLIRTAWTDRGDTSKALDFLVKKLSE